MNRYFKSTNEYMTLEHFQIISFDFIYMYAHMCTGICRGHKRVSDAWSTGSYELRDLRAGNQT